MKTLEQAVIWYEQFANACRYHNLTESQEEFEQLSAWLCELQERRKVPEIIFCKDCQYFKLDCQEPYCRIEHDYTSTNGYCHHAKRAERRSDGQKTSN